MVNMGDRKRAVAMHRGMILQIQVGRLLGVHGTRALPLRLDLCSSGTLEMAVKCTERQGSDTPLLACLHVALIDRAPFLLARIAILVFDGFLQQLAGNRIRLRVPVAPLARLWQETKVSISILRLSRLIVRFPTAKGTSRNRDGNVFGTSIQQRLDRHQTGISYFHRLRASLIEDLSHFEAGG